MIAVTQFITVKVTWDIYVLRVSHALTLRATIRLTKNDLGTDDVHLGLKD